MATGINSLLTILNTTNTQKNDPKLYDFLRRLLTSLQQVNEEGLATAVSSTTSGGTVTAVTATAPISSSGGTTPNITHDVSGVTPGTYGSSTTVPVVTFNVTGHATAAVDTPITFPSSDDYVVMSDGNIPIPNPMDDGAGNFIYITYTP